VRSFVLLCITKQTAIVLQRGSNWKRGVRRSDRLKRARRQTRAGGLRNNLSRVIPTRRLISYLQGQVESPKRALHDSRWMGAVLEFETNAEFHLASAALWVADRA
jgi:hypothetical protein